MLYAGALDAAWWAALGAATRWGPDYSGISHSETYSPAVTDTAGHWLRIGINLGSDSQIFQAPFITAETDGGSQTDDNNYDTGFFWITADSGPDAYAVQVAIPGQPSPIGFGLEKAPQCQVMEPYLNNGDIRPMSGDSPVDSAYYKTGFLYRVGYSTNMPYNHVVIFVNLPARGATAQVNHYSPFAWAGTPPAVVAAIMLQMGQAAGYVDDAAFADAHDALRDDTLGEVPIDGVSDVLEVYWTPTV